MPVFGFERRILGLIQNANEDLISMVRTLVESYVIGRNTLIVIAMPMSGTYIFSSSLFKYLF